MNQFVRTLITVLLFVGAILISVFLSGCEPNEPDIEQPKAPEVSTDLNSMASSIYTEADNNL